MAKIKQIDGLQDALDAKLDESILEAQSIIAAVTDDTPVAVTVAEQTLVGRITGGNIDDLSVAQVKTLLGAGAANGLATLNAASKVVENPTNAQSTPAANKIAMANASGKLASGWGGDASTLATLNASSKVVEDPANATATPTASKIPIADGSGKLDTWVSDASESVKGKVELATAAETATGMSDTLAVHPAGLKSVLDTFIASNDAMRFMGVIDCSTNPNYPAAIVGDTYKISVAGKIGGASGVNVEAGDTLICITDAVAGTHATVGTSWNIVQANLDGAVIGSDASVTTLKIAVFDGTSGKVIKAGTKTIAELQADLGVDETTLVHTVAATHAANTVFTITDFFLGHIPPANVKPIVNVNGIIIPNRATASFGLAWNASGDGGKDLSMILPYALDATGDTTTKDYIECTFATK